MEEAKNIKVKDTETFIQKANQVHTNKYDYSKTIYTKSANKLIVICPEHGDFEIKAGKHLYDKKGCPKCSSKKLTTETFIQKANLKHNNKYDYSKTTYTNATTALIVTCPEHGDFKIKAGMHLYNNVGCKKCSNQLKSENQKLTTEEIIKRFEKVHTKYDYSKVNYIDWKTKVEIICPTHGSFFQQPGAHIIGHGCKQCSFSILDTRTFIIEASKFHNNKYNYSKVNYIDHKTKVSIVCPKHGEFSQTPMVHMSCNGCPVCGREAACSKIRTTNEEFAKRANKIHNNKYDYSKVNYISSSEKVEIICPKHGSFFQTYQNHITDKNTCPKCNIEIQTRNRYLTKEIFVEKSQLVHGNKYDYSDSVFTGVKNKIKIRCPEHGEFKIIAKNHLDGLAGCPECGKMSRFEKMRDTKESFIIKATSKYGNKYTYEKVKYINSRTPIIITCPEHGDFFQTPGKFLYNDIGCPTCSREALRSKGEQKIFDILSKNNIEFIEQYVFDDCKNINVLPFDFYLPEHNLIIEYDGEQHFKEVSYFGGEKALEKTQKNDSIKNNYCINNNIELLRIDYKNFNNIENILKEILWEENV